MSHEKEIDPITGIATTGHVWDGDLKELNKPLPRWWLYVLYATIVWAIGYWVLYPAWPTLNAYTPGILNYSQRATVRGDVENAKAAQVRYRDAIGSKPLAEIAKDPVLQGFATAGGAAIFGDNCAGCHGRGAQGGKGFPNLNDDDWLWGGDLQSIYKTISFGIRSGHAEAHDSAMPRFGLDKILEPSQIDDLAAYVRSLAKFNDVDDVAKMRGAPIFAEQCAACHGDTGKGNPELGAPNLGDAIWLYGSSKDAVTESVRTGRGGMMPAWSGRLDDVSIKMLTLYVHGLGGGKVDPMTVGSVHQP